MPRASRAEQTALDLGIDPPQGKATRRDNVRETAGVIQAVGEAVGAVVEAKLRERLCRRLTANLSGADCARIVHIPGVTRRTQTGERAFSGMAESQGGAILVTRLTVAQTEREPLPG